jgi:hypothetical protein
MHLVSQICSSKLDWPSKDTLESEIIQNRPPTKLTIGLGNRLSGVYMQNSTNTTVNQGLMGVHKVNAFHPFIFQKSGKSTIIRNLAVPRHFVAYLVFISSIRVDPGPRNRGPTSLLALKIRTLWQTREIKVHRSSACVSTHTNWYNAERKNDGKGSEDPKAKSNYH